MANRHLEALRAAREKTVPAGEPAENRDKVPARVDPVVRPAAKSKNELVNQATIAGRLGVSRQLVTLWRQRHADFPRPRRGIVGPPLYKWGAVEEWYETRSKK